MESIVTETVPIIGVLINNNEIQIKKTKTNSYYYQLISNESNYIRTEFTKKNNTNKFIAQFFDSFEEAKIEADLDLEFIKKIEIGNVWNVEVSRLKNNDKINFPVNEVRRDGNNIPIISKKNNKYYYTLINEKEELLTYENGNYLLNILKSIKCFHDTLEDAKKELQLDLNEINEFGKLIVEKTRRCESEVENNYNDL